MSVPASLCSFLWGVLKTDFSNLKEFLVRKEDFTLDSTDMVLEELFRYLYLLTEYTQNVDIKISPSKLVDQAFHCLLLDPMLYHQICDALLTLNKKDHNERPIRLLPHNPLNGDDNEARKDRYENTLQLYADKFGHPAPVTFWPKEYEHLSDDEEVIIIYVKQ